MNNVSIIGRITKDIELRSTKSGLAAVSMFIAINNGKDEAGNERDADFPKVIVYDKQAENVNKYCHKGSLIAVTGRIKTSTWEKDDGSKGYETYILAGRVQFLETKKSEDTPIPEPEYASDKNKESNGPNPYNDFAEEITINPDDLPF